MSSTSSIVEKFLPAAELRPYIKEYVFRKIAATEDLPLMKLMPIRVSTSIDFFLGEPFQTFDCLTQETRRFVRCSIRGPRTFKKNLIKISGTFISFYIRCRPTGLYKLLGVPVHIFRDEDTDAVAVDTVFREILHRLYACSTSSECIAVVEPYLLGLARKAENRYVPKAVEELVNVVFTEEAPAKLSAVMPKISISPRQLERQFLGEIGVSPKLYANMIRFESMLRYKLSYPEDSWTSIAYKYNYCDQMHLIKAFKSFLGITPGQFKSSDFAF